MIEFQMLNEQEMLDVEGGCTWCKVGQTLIAVGGVLATGVNPAAVAIAAVSIACTWMC